MARVKGMVRVRVRVRVKVNLWVRIRIRNPTYYREYLETCESEISEQHLHKSSTTHAKNNSPTFSRLGKTTDTMLNKWRKNGT